MTRDDKFINRAAEVAYGSTYQKHQMGSVLAHGGKVIAIGCNSDTRVYIGGEVKYSLHTEVACLRGLSCRKKGPCFLRP